MLADYSTTLFSELTTTLKPRRVEKAMKTLDREILSLFAFEDRDFVLQLLPGLSSRRFGGRFGVQPKALRSGRMQSWDSFLELLQRDLRLKTQSEAEGVADAYIRAHVFLMTPQARLNFAATCSDDMMRSYLRALN